MKGLRFRKTIKLLPGLQINLSKTGASVSVGPKGARVVLGRGRPQVSLDLPGTGIYFRRALGSSNKDDQKNSEPADGKAGKETEAIHDGKSADTERQIDHQIEALNISPIQRLTMPPEQQELIDGMRDLLTGNSASAYDHLRRVTFIPDAAFLAGFLALRQGEYNQAISDLNIALAQIDELGRYFTQYDVDATVELPVTEDVDTQIGPDRRGVLFALTEAYQQVGQPQQAAYCVQQLHELDPDDLVVRLSMAELYSEAAPDDPRIQQEIVKLAEGVRNDSPLHASLMYYRARALRKLGLYEATQETLTQALRRKKDYPDDLLLALRYERALLYEATGKQKQADSEFQKVYAEAPDFEDVAAKVGLAK